MFVYENMKLFLMYEYVMVDSSCWDYRGVVFFGNGGGVLLIKIYLFFLCYIWVKVIKDSN